MLFIFTPIFGAEEPILTNIFFKGVETTNEQLVYMIFYMSSVEVNRYKQKMYYIF